MAPPTGWLPTPGTPIGVIMVKPIVTTIKVFEVRVRLNEVRSLQT